MTSDQPPATTDDMQVPIPPRLDGDRLSACIIEAQRIADEAMPEEERPDGVAFAILTDGFENASTDFTARDVKSRITHQTVRYNWRFQFLAANQDAITAGAGLGIAARACAQIDATEAGIECMCAPESSVSMALGEARMVARQARSRRRRK